MKKLIISFIFILLLSTYVSVPSSFAAFELPSHEVEDSGTPPPSLSEGGIFSGSEHSLSGFSCGEPLITEELNNEIDKYKKEDANMAEKFVASQAQNLVNIGDLNGLSTLIFGNPYCVWGGNNVTMSSDGIFTAEEHEKIVEPLMKLFGSCFFLVLIISMLVSGIKLGLNSVRGQALGDFGEDIWMWFVAVFLALSYGLITNLIFQMNAAVVLSISELISEGGGSLSSLSILYEFDAIHAAMGMGPFLILMVAEWILALILNFVYLARKVVITILLVLGFLAIYSLMFAKTRAFFGSWLREFLGNVFLQSIHAMVMFAMIMFAQTGSSTIFKLGLLMMFIPVSGMISKWLNIGDSSSRLGSSLTMVGLGGVMSTMMLASQAGNIIRGGNMFGGNSMSTNGEGMQSSNSSISNLANSLANDTGNTAITTSASGVNSPVWNATKGAMSTAGAIVGGTAGLVAGPAGVMLGAKGGQMVAAGALQMARNIPSGLTNVVSAVQQGKAFVGANGEGFRAMFSKNADANALLARRETMGNIGESLGSMLGVRAASVGRSLGVGLSGISRERLADAQSIGLGLVEPKTGMPSALSFQQLSSQFPGADAKWIQSNQGSAMYVNTADGWQQIGLTGAADTSLRDGEFRAADYKLSDPSMNYELQPNGTYRSQMGELGNLSGESSQLTDLLKSNTSIPINDLMAQNPSLSTPNINDLVNGPNSSDAIKNMTTGDFVSSMGPNAQSASIGSVLTASPIASVQSINDVLKDNQALGATTLGGLSQGSGAMSTLSFASNNGVLANSTIGSIAATSNATTMAEFASSNSAVGTATIGSIGSAQPQTAASNINDFLSSNSAIGNATLGDIVTQNPTTGSSTVGEFLATNPAISAESIGISSTTGADVLSSSVSDYISNNPSVADTTVSSIVGANLDYAATSTSEFMASNPAIASMSVSDTISFSSPDGSTSITDFMENNPAIASMSVSDAITMNPTIANAPVSDFMESNPAIANTSLSSVVSDNEALANMSVNDFVQNNPAFSDLSTASVIQDNVSSSMTMSDFVQQNPNIANADVGSMFLSNNTQTMDEFVQSNPTVASAILGSHVEPTIIGTSGSSVAGFKGSTPSLMRTSDAYIIGGPVEQNAEGQAVGYASSHINAGVAQHIASKEAPRYQDTNFRTESINPDSYLFHNPKGANRSTGSDNVANAVHKASSISGQWANRLVQQKKEKRAKKIV